MIHDDGHYECDYCHETSGEFLTATGNHELCQENAALRTALKEARAVIQYVKDMVECFPAGVDYEADENDTSPEVMESHIAGLIWKRIQKYGGEA